MNEENKSVLRAVVIAIIVFVVVSLCVMAIKNDVDVPVTQSVVNEEPIKEAAPKLGKEIKTYVGTIRLGMTTNEVLGNLKKGVIGVEYWDKTESFYGRSDFIIYKYGGMEISFYFIDDALVSVSQ